MIVSAVLSIMGLLMAAPAAGPDTGVARRSVWMMPPGSRDGICWRELFTAPQSWAETRSRVTVLGYASANLDKQFKDDELKAWLPQIDRWGLKLGLEVGAVKEWAPSGKRVFDVERKYWDRIRSLGGKIYSIAMDEPLCCVRQLIKKPDSFAIEETAQFIALVRANYPEIQIGDIEPYPYLQREELLGFIDALQARLKQMNVRGLDFFRLDVDWNHFTIGNQTYAGNWPDVKKLELGCRQRGLPFSLIYWDADYGRMKELKLADDSTWYVGIMRQGYDYTFVGGSPDEVVIESWIGEPSRSIPESDEWTFTRSVRDFCRRFVR